MKEITLLLKTLDPKPIYNASQGLGLFIFATITPVLLVIAISIRVTETQLDTTASLGKWGRAVKDFLLWGAVLSVYFGIAYLIADFMNTVYRIIDEIGSLRVVTDQAAQIIRHIQQNIGTAGRIANIFDPYTLALTLGYWASLTLVATLGAFLKVAHALGYSFAFVYGLIAIPISITSKMKLLRGWALLLGGLLLWPVIEGIMMGLFSLVFGNVAKELLGSVTPLDEAAYKFYFTIVNFVLAAVMISAPLVSGALVSNSSSLTQLVAPFMGAALAASFGGPAAPKKIATAFRALSGGASPQESPLKSGVGHRGPQPKTFSAMSEPSSSSGSFDGTRPAPEVSLQEGPASHSPELPDGGTAAPASNESSKQKRQKQRKGVFVWKAQMAKKPLRE